MSLVRYFARKWIKRKKLQKLRQIKRQREIKKFFRMMLDDDNYDSNNSGKQKQQQTLRVPSNQKKVVVETSSSKEKVQQQQKEKEQKRSTFRLAKELLSLSSSASNSNSTKQQKKNSNNNNNNMNKKFIQSKENPDRFDFVGTSNINELLKNRFVQKSKTQNNNNMKNNNELFLSERWRLNFVLQFLYPLHNTLQRNFNLDNEDEIQVLVGNLATTTTQQQNNKNIQQPQRIVFLATNNEKITQQHLDFAFQEKQKVAKEIFGIQKMFVINGEKNRHAEQKLVEWFASSSSSSSTTARKNNNNNKTTTNIPFFEIIHCHEKWQIEGKPLVIGERFPCVACRLFATKYEHLIHFLPSHGHLYLKTLNLTPSNIGDLSVNESFELLRSKGRVLG